MRFSAGLFSIGSADLGKRRRWVAFRVDSACETAQKLRAGFALEVARLSVFFGLIGSVVGVAITCHQWLGWRIAVAGMSAPPLPIGVIWHLLD